PALPRRPERPFDRGLRTSPTVRRPFPLSPLVSVQSDQIALDRAVPVARADFAVAVERAQRRLEPESLARAAHPHRRAAPRPPRAARHGAGVVHRDPGARRIAVADAAIVVPVRAEFEAAELVPHHDAWPQLARRLWRRRL